MCGFISIYSGGNGLTDEQLVKLRQRSQLLAHRGPDSSDEFVDEHYATIFHRLAIRGLDQDSNQPIQSDDGRYTICFNGEIYSFGQYEGSLSSYNSDTRCLARLLSKEEIKTVIESLRGMFALSIFDHRDKSLWLCRDHLGIKPLFYTRYTEGGNDLVMVSSEIKALNGIGRTTVLDREQCARFLQMGVQSDQPSTMFSDIKRLLPGEVVHISGEQWESFQLAKSVKNLSLRGSEVFDEKEHADFLANIIEDHLVSDVEIATTLSGGIDSSAVTLITGIKSAKPVRAYTLKADFFEAEIDAQSPVAKDNSIQLNFVNICTDVDMTTLHRDLVRRSCAPLGSASWLFQDYLIREIKEKSDLKVLLVGEGADEIYSGYKRLAMRFLLCANKVLEHSSYSREVNLLSSFLGASPSEIDAEIRHPSTQRQLDDVMTDYSDSMFWSLLDTSPSSELYYPSTSKITDSSEEMEVFYKQHLINHLTRQDIPNTLEVLDMASMSHGVEIRVPFLDIDLIERVLRYSWKEHIGEGFNKFMLRRCLAKVLPPEIINTRTKKQRPSAASYLIYSVFGEELKNYLKNNRLSLVDGERALPEFDRCQSANDGSAASFWFRVYSTYVFWDEFFDRL